MHFLAFGFLLMVVSCAPASPPTVGGQTTGGTVAFYPNQSGAVWQYLKDGERADSPPYQLRVEGPQSFNGRILTGMRFLGRGHDIYYYRQFDERGVQLISQGSTNFYELVYDTPVLEYPPQKELVVGKTWSAVTLVTLTQARQPAQRLRYTYSFRVAAKEKYKIGNTEYDAFLILRDNRLESVDGKTEPLIEAQRIRFVPFIGEVRTREGLVLVSYNFKR
ncbi:MAG: hypothetical protein ACK41E_10785 [Deinococcales bacterium]